MEKLVEDFINEIGKRDMFQRKALEKAGLEDEEVRLLGRYIDFNITVRNKTLTYLVEAYLFLINMFKEETYFFVVNDHYRHSTYEEVEESVYKNNLYMDRYMTGLSLSDYVIIPHLKMMRYFDGLLHGWGGIILKSVRVGDRCYQRLLKTGILQVTPHMI